MSRHENVFILLCGDFTKKSSVLGCLTVRLIRYINYMLVWYTDTAPHRSRVKLRINTVLKMCDSLEIAKTRTTTLRSQDDDSAR